MKVNSKGLSHAKIKARDVYRHPQSSGPSRPPKTNPRHVQGQRQLQRPQAIPRIPDQTKPSRRKNRRQKKNRLRHHPKRHNSPQILQRTKNHAPSHRRRLLQGPRNPLLTKQQRKHTPPLPYFTFLTTKLRTSPTEFLLNRSKSLSRIFPPPKHPLRATFFTNITDDQDVRRNSQIRRPIPHSPFLAHHNSHHHPRNHMAKDKTIQNQKLKTPSPSSHTPPRIHTSVS